MDVASSPILSRPILNDPLVSVLIPVRSAAFTLGRAIRSVLDQEFEAIEIVLVDNGMNDFPSLLQEFGEKERSLIRIIPESQTGITHALNTGLKHCRGRYIARLDADDEMLPGRLHLQAGYLNAHPGTGLIAGLAEYAGSVDQQAGYAFYVNQINQWVDTADIRAYRFVESPFAHPSVMFRKSLVEEYGGYSVEPVPEDYELWLRWMDKEVVMEKLPVPVLRWYDRPDRLSRTHENYHPASFDRVRYRYLASWLRRKLPQLPFVWVAGGGKLARKKIRLLEAEGIPVEGIFDLVPRNIPGKAFIPWQDVPPPGAVFIVTLVSNRGSFAEISRYLDNRGYEVMRNYICAG